MEYLYTRIDGRTTSVWRKKRTVSVILKPNKWYNAYALRVARFPNETCSTHGLLGYINTQRPLPGNFVMAGVSRDKCKQTLIARNLVIIDYCFLITCANAYLQMMPRMLQLERDDC